MSNFVKGRLDCKAAAAGGVEWREGGRPVIYQRRWAYFGGGSCAANSPQSRHQRSLLPQFGPLHTPPH